MALRFKMRDGAAPGRRTVRTCDVDERRAVAVYQGGEYVAENVGGDLIVNTVVYSSTRGTQKTWVATYGAGGRYTAERVDGNLVIYVAAEDAAGSTRTGDKMVRDALRSIRDNAASIKSLNQATDQFWGAQRSAQNAIIAG